MKSKILLIPILAFLFTSCIGAGYQHTLNSTPYGVDYREGNWLLNNIEAPLTIKDKMTELAHKHFKKELGSNFRDANTDKSIALSYIPINPDTLLLKRLKKESRSDYIINIKSEELSDNLGALKISDVQGYQSNAAQTTLQIYDLNTLEIIYNRTVTGSASLYNDDDKSFKFITTTNKIMVKSLKKILKRI